MRIDVISIFPGYLAPLELSLLGRAADSGLIELRTHDLRAWTHDRHRTVDDTPYGGGAGMVMKPGPFFEAVESIGAPPPIVLLSPRGKVFSHADAERFGQNEQLTLLCGHYKDIDQRVAEHLASEEISLGDFVLSGGEAAALAIIDATVRLLPGAMSDLDSARGDSFFGRGLSAPSYTRPPEFRGHAVPDVLLSGDHARIEKWRKEEGERLSQQRPAKNDASA